MSKLHNARTQEQQAQTTHTHTHNQTPTQTRLLPLHPSTYYLNRFTEARHHSFRILPADVPESKMSENQRHEGGSWDFPADWYQHADLPSSAAAEAFIAFRREYDEYCRSIGAAGTEYGQVGFVAPIKPRTYASTQVHLFPELKEEHDVEWVTMVRVVTEERPGTQAFLMTNFKEQSSVAKVTVPRSEVAARKDEGWQV